MNDQDIIEVEDLDNQEIIPCEEEIYEADASNGFFGKALFGAVCVGAGYGIHAICSKMAPKLKELKEKRAARKLASKPQEDDLLDILDETIDDTEIGDDTKLHCVK